MKLTKRIKKGIIQSVIFSGIFFLILLSVFVIFAYPKISEIEIKKQELGMTYDKYNTTLIKGLPYNEVKDNFLNGEETDYTRLLLKNVTEDFYEAHFTNTGSIQYITFLDSVREDISIIKKSDEFLEKDKNLNVFLPTYNGNNSSGDTIFGDEASEQDENNENETLTDFYFINYIENLLYSFNLSYEGDIGVGDIINIDKEEIDDTKGPADLLEENIFAIPLSFSLVGRKSDMVDFLHYFENVAQIKISEDGFIVPNDNFISKRIEGAENSGEYNIYENQLADIVSLSLNEYPNSSVKTTDSLIFAMKTLQGKEKFEMDVELQFYVAGVPGYKMQAYINKLLQKYTSFSALLKKDTQKFLSQKYKYSNSIELTAIQILQNLETLVIALEKDINLLKKESAKGDKIEETYDSATQYNKQLEKINKAYEQQMKILIK